MIKRPLYGGTTIGGNSYRKGQYIHECIYERMVDLRRVLEDIKVVRDEGHSIGASAYTPKRAGEGGGAWWALNGMTARMMAPKV